MDYVLLRHILWQHSEVYLLTHPHKAYELRIPLGYRFSLPYLADQEILGLNEASTIFDPKTPAGLGLAGTQTSPISE